MKVEILILDLPAISSQAGELYEFWCNCILSIKENNYKRLLHVFYLQPDIAKKVSPYLYNLALTSASLLSLELKEEEIEDEMRRIKKLAGEEAENLWDTIDKLIIDSYKDFMYDITGSDKVVQIYIRGVIESNILKSLSEAKHGHKYIDMMDICRELYAITIKWFEKIENLVIEG